MAECAHCSSQFQKRSGGYKRYSIENDLSCGKNAREIYEEENGVPFPVTESKRKGYFLCDNCWTVLNRVAKYRESVKEFWSLSSSNSYTGVKRSLSDDETGEEKYTEKGVVHVAKKHRSSAPMLIPKPIPKSASCNKYESVISNMRRHKYAKVVRGLWNTSDGWRRNFCSEFKKIIRREVSNLIKEESNFPLCQKASLLNIEAFSWRNTLSMVEKQAPLLFTALEGIVVKNKEDSIISNTSLERIVGTALSCLLKGRAPQKATFIPTVNSVQIYKGGLKQETLKEISRTGFCLSHDATLNAINRLGTEFDNAAKTYEETSDLEIVASSQDSDSESESALSCQEEDETDLA